MHTEKKSLWDGTAMMLPTASAMWVQGKVVLLFMLLQLVLMRVVPGEKHYGPVSANGIRPLYTDNGISCMVISMVAYALAVHFEMITPGGLFPNYCATLGFLNLFAFVFCLLLYLKGMYLPSGPDVNRDGGFIYLFYSGVELYPRIFGWDVKQFFNTRVGMMGWLITIMDLAAYQHQEVGYVSQSMMVSVLLQTVYITKFFAWSKGYCNSMDIHIDYAGYYLIWGVTVWIPAIYVAPTLYLATHPVDMGFPMALAVTILGMLSIAINYDADRQRLTFRQRDGKVQIWGKKATFIKAQYETEDGKTRQNLLLTSGWWGFARHPQYLPEVCAAFFWSCPGGFSHFFPFSYVTFLVILLIDRSWRDDARCRAKYGTDWEKYCRQVPARMIPFLF